MVLSSGLCLIQLCNRGQTSADVTLLFTWAVSSIVAIQLIRPSLSSPFYDLLSAVSLGSINRILWAETLDLLVIISTQSRCKVITSLATISEFHYCFTSQSPHVYLYRFHFRTNENSKSTYI